MKAFYSIVSTIFIGIVLGASSAYQAISTGWGLDVKTNGSWRIYENLAEPELSLYAKAYLVNSGHLPLPQDQALYFFTYEDAVGEPLNTRCDYRLIGDNVNAFWWSISAHSTDFKRFENSSLRYSFNMANVIRNGDGKYNISLSKKVASGNWLPLATDEFGNDGAFMLSLRLYGIEKHLVDDIATLSLPQVKKMGCAE